MRVGGTVSTNIIDRRKHVGAGAIAGILTTLLAWFGVNRWTGSSSDPDRDIVFVVSSALDRGQEFWREQVPGYRDAKLVLFEATTLSGCGVALATSGPFWCSEDDRIYVDVDFLRAIKGDLGRAIVIGHELAHHVQAVLGKSHGRPSIAIELEADCLAGRWMLREKQLGNLDAGDVLEALQVIESVGDDRVCPGCSPESWSHGSSSQRLHAVMTGLAGGSCWSSPP